ncbi:MAG: hypothetical protein JXB85_08125 [Anaerolineales bacterium]|nr:hypothetical protein [Anaerolineales bacterium]
MLEDVSFAAICFGGTAFFLLLFAFLLLLRFLNYKETLALAEKGLLRLQEEKKNGKSTLLTPGVIVAGIGLAVILGMWPIGAAYGDYPLGFGPWMIVGLLPLFIGLSMILVYALTRKTNGDGDGE